MNVCQGCNGQMKPLWGARWYCVNECDLKPAIAWYAFMVSELFQAGKTRGLSVWGAYHLISQDLQKLQDYLRSIVGNLVGFVASEVEPIGQVRPDPKNDQIFYCDDYKMINKVNFN